MRDRDDPTSRLPPNGGRGWVRGRTVWVALLGAAVLAVSVALFAHNRSKRAVLARGDWLFECHFEGHDASHDEYLIESRLETLALDQGVPVHRTYRGRRLRLFGRVESAWFDAPVSVGSSVELVGTIDSLDVEGKYVVFVQCVQVPPRPLPRPRLPPNPSIDDQKSRAPGQ